MRNRIGPCLAVLAFALLVSYAPRGRAQATAPDIVVNSTGDQMDPAPSDGICDVDPSTSGLQCTLRAAIQTANGSTAGANVSFEIPLTDPGYAAGVFTIRPTTNLPTISADHVVIDGTTQTAFNGDTNPDGPEVVLNGAADTSSTKIGLSILGGQNVVRGLVINGFFADACSNCIGIWISGFTELDSGTRVEGCYVGTDASGAAAVPNNNGIVMEGATGSIIGGTTPGAGNVISGNILSGVRMTPILSPSRRTVDAQLEGNLIGTDRLGTGALGNFTGVEVTSGTGNLIGGTSAEARNLISANRGGGIVLTSQGSERTMVLGNYIGVDVTGAAPLGNAAGVVIRNGSALNRIGGVNPGEGNRIAFNAGDGVQIGRTLDDSFTRNNVVVGNFISDNGGLGIDLGADGVTPNDPGDGDTGPNALLNAPVLVAATSAGGTTTIGGVLLDVAPGTYFVDLYASNSCDTSGYGEGAQWLGRVNVTPDAAGYRSFTIDLPSAFGDGVAVTATTTLVSTTSEFSACALVNEPLVADLAVSTQASPDPAVTGGALTYTLSVANSGPDGASNVTLNDVLPAGATVTSIHASQGSCAGTAVVSCALGILTPGRGATVEIVVTAPSAGTTAINTATVTGAQPDPVTTNNEATTTTQLRAPVLVDLAIGQTASHGPVVRGNLVTLFIQTSNAGPGPASAVSVVDVLPAGTTFVSASASQGNCAHVGGTVTCALGSVAAGASPSIAITVQSLAVGAAVSEATVSTADQDVDSSNNTATLPLNIVAASTLRVTKTPDTNDGLCDAVDCSLREAIVVANLNPGAQISFGIPPSDPGFEDGVFTIRPTTNLPSLTANRVVIDGTTQRIFGGDTNPDGLEVVLSGAQLAVPSPVGLSLLGQDVVIRGLVIHGFQCGEACGIGISILGAGRASRVEGCYVGTDADGRTAVANTVGLQIFGANAVVGGTTPGAGNVIAGNAASGVSVNGAAETLVEGNLIGADATGTMPVPNGVGIRLEGAIDAVIGGTAPGAGNVISGNSGAGVLLDSQGLTHGLRLEGNLIGTDRLGTGALGNDVGVEVLNGISNVIGGTSAAARNTISGNRRGGIVLRTQTAIRTSVLGNYIGTDVTGTAPLGNGNNSSGVQIFNGARANDIGGANAGEGNRIAFNARAGVQIGRALDDTTTRHNAVVGNAIVDNGGLGIDLASDGVTLNDPGDADTGPNTLLNAPVMQEATSAGGLTTIRGGLPEGAGGTYQVDLYANSSCDASGYGEGERWLGRVEVIVGGLSADFVAQFGLEVPVGEAVTATASLLDVGASSWSTSEFSACVFVTPPPDTTPPVILPTVTPTPNAGGWNILPPTVTWAVDDAESAIASSAGCGATTVTQDTSGVTLTCSAVNGVGLSASASVTVKLDTAAPAITSERSPAANANGWYRTNVTVDFTCTDALSGVAVHPADSTLTSEGANQSVTASCRDVAGNVRETTESGINIDKTAPSVTATPSRTSDLNGWYNHAFDITWSAVDTLSGVASCRPPLTHGGPDTGTGQVAGACEDQAGNRSEAAFGFMFDATAPTITITQPAGGASFPLHQTVVAAYSCADALSGVLSCIGPVASGASIDTSTAGSRTFTVNAVDIAGNAATLTHQYSVRYVFEGFLSPLNNLPTTNRGPAGRTFPVKWILRDGTGASISDPAAITGVALVPGACGTVTADVSGELTSVNASGLMYDPLTGMWQFNWATKKSQVGCWVLEVRLADGNVYRVGFDLR